MKHVLRCLRQRGRESNGFTLPEVLIAIVIGSLIIGALTAGLLVSLDNTQTVTNRLSDSLDSQISGAYFVRDVQGASDVTTDPSITSYTAVSPELCPPAPAPGSTLIVGLYHAAGGSVPVFDVGYWEVPNGRVSQIIRYSCSLSANFTTILGSTVVIADNVTSPPLVNIRPCQFSTCPLLSSTGAPLTGASAGWAPTVAQTTVQIANSSTNTLSVVSLQGFCSPSNDPSCGGDVNLQTPLGTQVLTGCTPDAAVNPPTLTCSGGIGNAASGDTVSQDSVTGVNLSVSQQPANLAGGPPVEYRYSLTAAPRTQAPWGEGPGSGGPPGGPGPGPGPGNITALLTLAGAICSTSSSPCNLSGATKLTIDGTAQLDGTGGGVNCTGNSTLTATAIDTYDTSLSGCGATTATGYMPDPLAPYLPSCFPAQPPAAKPTTYNGDFVYWPGSYTQSVPPQGAQYNGATFYFEPGVYEFDAGFNVGNTQFVSIAPTSIWPQGTPAGSGVLFYVPGPEPAAVVPGCAYSPVSPTSNKWSSVTMNLGAQASVGNLPPLSAAQSKLAFDGNPALAGVWVWQDHTNSNASSLGGGSSATACSQSSGTLCLAYLPSSQVTLYGGPGEQVGEIICASLVLKGSSTVIITG